MRALLLLTKATTTQSTMMLARHTSSSSSAAVRPTPLLQQQQRRRRLVPPPRAASAADDARPASPSPASYLAQSLLRERLAYQQRRGLSSSSSSSTSSVDEAAAATPTSVRPPRHHQARHYARLVRAFKRGRLGFGFSAGGLLFPYYAGVISEFRRLGVMPASGGNDAGGLASSSNTTPHLAGASAGALIAAVANAGVPLPVVEEACIELAADCLANGTPGRLGPALRALLEKHLPPDAHLRCRGNTFVAVTRVVPVWRPMLVSDFRSREDLIEALMASAHIPLYLDGRWATRFRGQIVIDGGATSFVPSPPLRRRRRRKEAGVERSSSSSSPLPRYFASEAEEARARREAEEARAWEGWDPDETEHEEEDEDESGNGNGNGSGSDHHNQGAVDAVVKICCFPTWHLASLRTAAASVTPSLGAVAEALRADVSPDAFEPFPHDLATVARWALVASPRETFDFLLARGRRDASLFARESGLEEAAAEAKGRASGKAEREPAPPPAPEPPVADNDGKVTTRGGVAA
jgi:hypothetical protein